MEVDTHAHAANTAATHAADAPKESKKRTRDPTPPPAAPTGKREKKAVEAFAFEEKEKKEVVIPTGSGTKLRDIEAIKIAFDKLNGADGHVKKFHKVLYGVAGVKLTAKRNIFDFSGFNFPAGTDVDKEMKAKHEVLESMTKDELGAIVDGLALKNVHKSKPKNEVIDGLLEFLKSPNPSEVSAPAKKTKRSKSASKKDGKSKKTKSKSKTTTKKTKAGSKPKKASKKAAASSSSSSASSASSSSSEDDDDDDDKDADHAPQKKAAKPKAPKAPKPAAAPKPAPKPAAAPVAKVSSDDEDSMLEEIASD